MLSLFKNPKTREILALSLLALAAIMFYGATYNHSSYSFILRADEGTSFATAMRVLQGEVPQRDFPSYYGPVMPYVYAAALKVFGESLAVLRASWAVLYGISVLLFYRIGRKLLPPLAAFAVAAMVIGQQHPPLYTYNHIGLVLAIEGVLLLLLTALSGGIPRYFRAALTALLLLALFIKFNEALVVFVAVLLTLWIINRLYPWHEERQPALARIPLRQIVVPGVIALALFAVVTTALNTGLSGPQFLRNFPMLPQYQASIGGYKYVKLVLSTPFHVSLAQMTERRWYVFWQENYVFAILAGFLTGILAIIWAARVLLFRKVRLRMPLEAWKSAVVIAVAAGTYHEFYLTGNHWSTPMYIGFALLALVLIIWFWLSEWPVTRYCLVGALLLACVALDVQYVTYARRHFSEFYLDIAHARIYSSRDSDAPVVEDVVRFLQTAPDQGQPLAAFPHDATLIYFAGRRNALRDDDYQWMLFPSRESDEEVVHELQTKNVPQILVSNFVGIRHGTPVIFGRDYLPLTFQYIQEHYHVVASFGPPRGYQVDYLELDPQEPAR